jgi:hypothetical protein
MPPVGFEPTIAASERPYTYASDRTATGTGNIKSVVSTKTIRQYKGEGIENIRCVKRVMEVADKKKAFRNSLQHVLLK